MKPQLAMVIDQSRCIDCKGCMAACKVANAVPDGQWRNWIQRTVPDFSAGPLTRQAFQPGNCMQCDEPTCVAACPTGATWKDPADGVVHIDRALCIGCGNCIPACPYGARYRHPTLRVADKCDFCAARRARGQEPACVATCPTKSRAFGDLSDPQSPAARLLAARGGKAVRVIHAASDTKPNLYYVGGAAPADWPVQAVVPTPMRLMTDAIAPGLKILAGLTGLGVAALAAREFLVPKGDGRDRPKE